MNYYTEKTIIAGKQIYRVGDTVTFKLLNGGGMGGCKITKITNTGFWYTHDGKNNKSVQYKEILVIDLERRISNSPAPAFPFGFPGTGKASRNNTELKNNINDIIYRRATGKVDMSGREVREGDIIEIHVGTDRILDGHFEIKYGTWQAYCPVDKEYMDSVGFYVSSKDYPDMPLGRLEDYAEVIGNIYDNQYSR